MTESIACKRYIPEHRKESIGETGFWGQKVAKLIPPSRREQNPAFPGLGQLDRLKANSVFGPTSAAGSSPLDEHRFRFSRTRESGRRHGRGARQGLRASACRVRPGRRGARSVALEFDLGGACGLTNTELER